MTIEIVDVIIWQLLIGLVTLYYIQYRFNELIKKIGGDTKCLTTIKQVQEGGAEEMEPGTDRAGTHRPE